MAENSKIGWTHHTANLWWGCIKVHAGCDHCYAETLDNRYNNEKPHWGPGSERKGVKSVWALFDKLQKQAAAKNEIHRVFVGSMMDIFEKSMPLEKPIIINCSFFKTSHAFTHTEQLRQAFFEFVIPACPNLQFLLLTKRPSNINKMIPEAWKANPPENVMFGTSLVNQATADRLIPQLHSVNGYRFLSMEPLLGPVNLNRLTYGKISWIIVGGESGIGARPMNLHWPLVLMEFCKPLNIPFFFKQWGEYMPTHIARQKNLAYSKDVIVSIDGIVIEERQENDCRMALVGTANAGNELLGKKYEQFPNHYKL